MRKPGGYIHGLRPSHDFRGSIYPSLVLIGLPEAKKSALFGALSLVKIQ
jgi:hypothetical protein